MKLLPVLLLCCCALPYSSSLHAQTPTTVTRVQPDNTRDKIYVNEVKIIDEFIERFNDDKNSFLRAEYKRTNQPFNFTRRKLIQLLFNTPQAWIKKPEVKSFISQVVDSTHPQLLSLNDSNWYAEVYCLFSSGGREITIPVIMQLVSTKDSGATWMLSGVGTSPVFTNHISDKRSKVKEEPFTYRKSIAPNDHATNFLALHRVLSPVMNPKNYFMPALLSTDRGAEFVQLIKSGKLKYEHTLAQKFYFFQVPGYVFTVENFIRTGLNTGWLINDLKKATAAQKTTQKEELLQRPL